jgi:hypothetical protein
MEKSLRAAAAGSAQIGQLRRNSLPAIWPGYVLALTLIIIDFVDFSVVIFSPSWADVLFLSAPPGPFYIVFLVYWLFCIYRVHAVIRDASACMYPISPAKAVGFHFIPFFNLYWIFRWTSCIADFVNTGQTVRMMRIWPGIGLLVGCLLGALVGTFEGNFNVEIICIVNFTVMLYIVRKLDSILTQRDWKER